MGKVVRIDQVDAATGEILEGATLAVVYPRRKNGFQVGGWIAMGQQPMEALANDPRMGREAWRVFALVVARLDYENWLRLGQADLARALGMKPSAVSRAMRTLLEVGVCLEGPKVGNVRTYRLDPHYGWKGSAKGHNQALQRVK